MKNITVTVDDDLYRTARMRAAELGTSVTALVRDFLEREVAAPSAFDQLVMEQEAVLDAIAVGRSGFAASRRFARDNAHDRNALR